MAQWEYSLVWGPIAGKGPERDFLDRWGRDEWELVQVVRTGEWRYPLERPGLNNPEYGFYYFKRPRRRAGLLGGLADMFSSVLIWGRFRSRGAMPDRMPGLEPEDRQRHE